MKERQEGSGLRNCSYTSDLSRAKECPQTLQLNRAVKSSVSSQLLQMAWKLAGRRTNPHSSLAVANLLCRTAVQTQVHVCQWARRSFWVWASGWWAVNRRRNLRFVGFSFFTEVPRFLCMNGEGLCCSELFVQIWKYNLGFTELPNLKLLEDLSLSTHVNTCLGLSISSTGCSATPGPGCASCNSASDGPVWGYRAPSHTIIQSLSVHLLPSDPWSPTLKQSSHGCWL